MLRQKAVSNVHSACAAQAGRSTQAQIRAQASATPCRDGPACGGWQGLLSAAWPDRPQCRAPVQRHWLKTIWLWHASGQQLGRIFIWTKRQEAAGNASGCAAEHAVCCISGGDADFHTRDASQQAVLTPAQLKHT